MPQRQPPDRQSTLNLAASSLKILGLASGGWGMFFVFAWGYLNRSERFRPYFIALGLIIWLIPGVLFYLCGWFIDRERSRRAAIGAMIIAAIHGLFAIAGFVASVTFPPVSPIPILLCILWIAAIAQLLIHLQRSLPLLATRAHHGFDITPLPITPRVEDRQKTD